MQEEVNPVNPVMIGRVVVSIAVIIALIAAGVWDVYAAYSGRPVESVSVVLQDWSRKWPILPVMVGILIGHLFWPTYQSPR